ncbi:MAG: hypothetical protein Fur0042_07020 [Cyanophyceae cyanobacterium]
MKPFPDLDPPAPAIARSPSNDLATDPNPNPSPDQTAATGDRSSLGSLLAAAVRLGVQTQVERAEGLTVAIEGKTRQILSGHVPRVRLAARSVIYRGLHLGDVAIAGGPIRVAPKALLKGQPLQLLEAIAVDVHWRATAADLNQSLESPLFATALAEAIAPLGDDLGGGALTELSLAIAPEGLALAGRLSGGQRVQLKTGLTVAAPNRLLLTAPTWTRWGDRGPETQPPLTDVPIPLADAEIDSLTLTDGAIACRGRLWIRP